MDRPKLPYIEIGYQVFVPGSSEALGAVRDVAPDGRPELRVYVENAGDFTVPLEAVRAVVEEKVVLDTARLPDSMRAVIQLAHAGEQPGL
ncbi:MAG: hypothetical protein JST54_00720 [Deltaproteobacteria bacterium]|nr:hypothetical protein [Deltaproteobacteria bacterium]